MPNIKFGYSMYPLALGVEVLHRTRKISDVTLSSPVNWVNFLVQSDQEGNHVALFVQVEPMVL